MDAGEEHGTQGGADLTAAILASAIHQSQKQMSVILHLADGAVDRDQLAEEIPAIAVVTDLDDQFGNGPGDGSTPDALVLNLVSYQVI